MKKTLIRSLLLIVLLLLAVVLGSVIGSAAQGASFLSWLGMSTGFGLEPVTLDLAILQFTFGLSIRVNVAQAILLLAAILGYTRIHVKE